jgi:dihydropyrimidine dehydrogenase (NAD+) subunit PreA
MKIIKEADISVKFCGVEMPNPFMLSSAPPTGTGEMIKRAFKAGWGGAVTKTLALNKDLANNVTPRLASLSFPGKTDEPKKLYGLENIELITDRSLDIWLSEIKEIKNEYPEHLLVASIMAGGNDESAWKELAAGCQTAGADMLELNFSCPHGMPEKGMGSAIGQNPEITKKVTSWVRNSVKIPIIAKMTPNITDICVPARAAIEGRADAISAINTVASVMGVDLKTLNPLPDVGGKSTHGGYSGPAIKPIALKAVSSIASELKIPISGIGGIESWSDTAEFILLGATTVQICTAVMFHGFRIIEELTDGLRGFMEDHGFEKIDDFIGLSVQKLTDHTSLDRSIKMISSIDKSTCVKCDLCVVSCRDAGYQALSTGEDRIPVVDEKLCTGCSLCVQCCPVWDCIKLIAV